MLARKITDPYRFFTSVALFVVSSGAAAVSFMHVSTVAIRYGQPQIAGYILPITVDGTIVVSSLTMLRAARFQVTSPWLARVMLLLSVGATLACNMAFGLAHGIPGALVSGWPAISFTGSAELAISMTRRKAARIPVASVVTRAEHESRLPDAISGGNGDSIIPLTDLPLTRVSRQIVQESAALAAISANPDIGFPELALKLGVSESTARRVRARLDSKVMSDDVTVTAA